VWDAATGEEVRTLKGHTSWVKSVAFSHDGTRIVSGSSDNSVRVWDAATGEEVRTLKGHTSSVFSVAFSHDGTRIVSGSRDNSVRVWDAATGEEVRTLKGHTSSVNSVAFSHDGTRIVSGSEDNSVRVWDAATGEEVRMLKGHTSSVKLVAFSHDGTRIISRSSDNSVHAWDAFTGEKIILNDDTLPEWYSPNAGQSSLLAHLIRNLPSMRICGDSSKDIPAVVDRNGWVFSDSAAFNRLMWIQSSLHATLHSTYSILIISPNGSARISFERSNLGTDWAQCYVSDHNFTHRKRHLANMVHQDCIPTHPSSTIRSHQ
jgi:WD40 repeat protein